MRDGWRQLPLGNVLQEIHRPVLVADLAEVRYAGVRWYAEGVYAREPVPASEVKTKMLTEVRAGDITYNRMWATKASFGLAHDDVDGCHVSNDFPIFEVNTAETTGEFIELIFQTDGFQSEAAARATGTTERRRLKQRDFEAITFPLPPLDEQRRIADLLAAVDDAIEAAEDEAAAASELLNAMLDTAVSDSCTTIGKAATISSGASWGKSDIRAANDDDASPVLTIANTKPDGSVSGEPTYVAGLSGTVGRLSQSSIVAIRTNGNHDRIGNVYRVPPAYLGAAISAFQLIIDPSDPADSDHLFWMLRAPRFQAEVTAAASGSTGLGNIAATKLRAMEVPWPADAEARAARVAMYEDMAASADSARAAADALRTLRSNLLTVLLSGEHEIPASYDALLEVA